jgi:site-specific DNA-methyltransferase (adenine-specific)
LVIPQGLGTALKPAAEFICCARKPLSERNVAANVLRWGTGAINVDACRIEGVPPQVTQGAEDRIYGGGRGLRSEPSVSEPHPSGRWPANVLLDADAAALLDEQSGERATGELKRKQPAVGWNGAKPWRECGYGGDSGGASRFFYTAKADSSERSEGLGSRSHHPTVKPVDLMAWLVKLVTPAAGIVLDPFAGSGSTLIAAQGLGFDSIGIEQSQKYAELARERIGLFVTVSA